MSDFWWGVVNGVGSLLCVEAVAAVGLYLILRNLCITGQGA